MLNVPVNNFSVMLGRSHRFLGITSTFFFFGGGGVNMSWELLGHEKKKLLCKLFKIFYLFLALRWVTVAISATCSQVYIPNM